MTLVKGNNRMIDGAAVNVRDFGAVGDGSTDDTAAIQAALDKGGVVVFPTATYIMAGTVKLTVGVIVDLCGSTIRNTAGVSSAVSFDINNQSGCVFKDGTMEVQSTGKMIYGNAKKLLIDNVAFVRGTLAIQLQGEYGDEVYDVVIRNCRHDGRSSGGGFVSIGIGSQLVIEGCNGKDGSEFLDFNNICSYVRVSNCVSQDYSQNHWDVNSTRNAVFTGNTIVSLISVTSRPIWIGEYTGSNYPPTAPERLKLSDNIIIDGNTFIISALDYTEFLIFNSGVTIAPDRTQQYVFSNNIVDCRDTFYGRTSFKFGTSPGISSFDISDNKFINCGIEVMGLASSVGDNTFHHTLGDGVGTAIYARLLDSTISGNQISGLTGTATDNANGGVMVMFECHQCLISGNNFSTAVDCDALITSTAHGTLLNGNDYIENRFHVTVTDPGGVRDNGGRDTVIFNAQVV